MILSLLVLSLGAVVAGTALLLVAGHRLRSSGTVRNLGTAAVLAFAVGEVGSWALALPSTTILAAQVTLVVATFGVGRLRPRWNPIGVWFFASVAVASGAYVALAVVTTARGGLSPAATGVSCLVLALEVAALALAASFVFETCDVACRTAPDRVVAPPSPQHRPFVSLHVAAYNEPPEMLIETIRSLEAIDYSDFEIVVVDNNTIDEEVWRPVEAYCAGRPRVTFVHVAPWPGFKSGALNLVLGAHTDPRAEVIGVVDADYLVRPDYLERMVGHFADPALAFVQTPQDYREWEGDRYLTALHDSYAYFFSAAMRSRNQRNSIIFGGTMGLIRRSVLEEIGGWDEWCITEDAEASFRILRAGHRGLYVHESFGQGIMPLTFSALKRQRFRWCFGGVQILRKHWRSMLPWSGGPANRLTLAQRLDYLVGGMQWFIDLVALGFSVVALAAAALAVAGRPVAFRPFLGVTILVPAVLGATGLLRALWGLRRLNGISTGRAFLAFVTWLSLSWTVALACAKGIVRRDGVFLRTPKWRSGGGIVDALRATAVETALVATLWTAALLVIATAPSRTRVLALFLLWQGGVYATAPLMAWLNQHTELSARLERRARTEERRERLGAVQPHLFRGALAVLVFAGLALVGAGSGDAGDQDPLELPRRGSGDRGPLGNVLSGNDLAGDADGTGEADTSGTDDRLDPDAAVVTTSPSGRADAGPSTPSTTSATTAAPSSSSVTTSLPPATTPPPTTPPTSTPTTSTTAPTTTRTTTAPPTSSPPTSSGPPSTASPPSSRPDRT